MAAVPPTLLYDLSPVASSGLAVCLAYLALERFRYRSAIELAAKSKRDLVKVNGDHDIIDVVRDLKWLCRDFCNGHAPRGWWANLYRYTFRQKVDEISIAFLAGICGFTLFAGVALKDNILSWPSMFNTSEYTNALFWVCFAGVAIPALSVLCGRKCMSWGEEFARHCEEQINAIMRQSAQSAEVPAE